MALELKDVTDALGLSKIPETVEEFNAEINKTFVPRNEAHKDPAIKGTVLGSAVTAAKREAKSLGIEFGEEDKFEKDDIVGFTKIALGKLDKKAKEFEAKIGQPNDEITKNLKTELEQAKLKAGDFENKWKTVGQELENEKANATNTIKSFKLATKFNEIKSKTLNYNPDVDEVKKEGFESILNKTFSFDIDDNDNIIVVDAKTKLQIANPKKAGTFLSPEEAIRNLGIEKKVISINPNAGQKVGQKILTAGQQQAVENTPTRKASNKVVRVN